MEFIILVCPLSSNGEAMVSISSIFSILHSIVLCHVIPWILPYFFVVLWRVFVIRIFGLTWLCVLIVLYLVFSCCFRVFPFSSTIFIFFIVDSSYLKKYGPFLLGPFMISVVFQLAS